jgi:hypothetical protein
VGGAVAAVVFFTVVVGRGTLVVVVSSTVVVVSSTVVVVSSSGTESSPGATVVGPSHKSSYSPISSLNTLLQPFSSYADDSSEYRGSSLQPIMTAAPSMPTRVSLKNFDPFFMSVTPHRPTKLVNKNL